MNNERGAGLVVSVQKIVYKQKTNNEIEKKNSKI